MYRNLRIQVVRKADPVVSPPTLSPEESLSVTPPTQTHEEERLHPKTARQRAQYHRLVDAYRSKRTGQLSSVRRDQKLAAIRQQADCLARLLEIPHEEHTSNFT